MIGYERVDLVETRGQYAVRGGIIDIACEEKTGIRIELWGDEIDSIRMFDIATQRSTSMTQEISVYPAFEMILENDIETVCKNIESKFTSPLHEEKVNEDIATLIKHKDEIYDIIMDSLG